MAANTHNYVVIMAGGIGSRFWPMSRTEHPKQFLDILGTGRTLMQQTYDRSLAVCPKENILVVTNAAYRELVLQQLPDLAEGQVLLEPARRNTAPCIAFAAFHIHAKDPEACMVVAPSDHLILKEEAYTKLVNRALKVAAAENALITLGIKPTRPDTGYGYIQFKEEPSVTDKEVKRVKTFTEKPDLEMAEQFIASGDFLWNAGIFVWSVKSILRAFATHLPDEYQLFNEGCDNFGTANETAFIERTYSRCTNISIDYGIMEKAENVFTLAADIGWSDLGTWGSLYSFSDKDGDGNVIQGRHVVAYDTRNCIVNMPKDKLVVLQGMEDMIVVESGGILLVCKREEEQQIKRIVNDVKATKGDRFV
ncbi:MAG: NTP transferase domain-containing protein [Flavobacteriales bacterium]|nr:NTP transferase domain-containing protein [Flavobacteriales bacterium]